MSLPDLVINPFGEDNGRPSSSTSSTSSTTSDQSSHCSSNDGDGAMVVKKKPPLPARTKKPTIPLKRTPPPIPSRSTKVAPEGHLSIYSQLSSSSGGGVDVHMRRVSTSKIDSLRHKIRVLRRSQSFELDLHTTTLWATIIPAEVLVETTKMERNRQEAIFELIQSEKAYLYHLQTVVEVFYQPMLQVLPSRDLHIIFSNLEELLLCNTELLSAMERRQKSDDFLVSGIGDIFLQHVTSLSNYVVYCGNQYRATKHLNQAKKNNVSLQSFFKEKAQDERCRNLDLASFLLEPLQRVTRYTLLLKQILAHTPPDHPDHDPLQKAMTQVMDILQQANEQARQSENDERIFEISQSVDLSNLEEYLDLSGQTCQLKKRVLLIEGNLSKAKSGRKLMVYLFNDLLLLTQPHSFEVTRQAVYRMPLLLDEITINANPTHNPLWSVDDKCFQLLFQKDSLILRAESLSSKKKWIIELERAISTFFSVEKNFYQEESTITDYGQALVQISQAYNLRLYHRSTTSDAPPPNAFCHLSLGSLHKRTKIIRSSNPRWDQLIRLPILSKNPTFTTLKISVLHSAKFAEPGNPLFSWHGLIQGGVSQVGTLYSSSRFFWVKRSNNTIIGDTTRSNCKIEHKNKNNQIR